MHDPVMGAPETERLQLMVGIAHKVTIGKEQEFDEVPSQITKLGLFGRFESKAGRGLRKIYVSHIDVS